MLSFIQRSDTMKNVTVLYYENSGRGRDKNGNGSDKGTS